MKNQRILITGAFGFVGSNLTKNLIDEGATVACLDIRDDFHLLPTVIQSKATKYIGDISNMDYLRKVISDFEPNIIFHLAAQTLVEPALKDPLTTLESNIRGTWNLLETVRNSLPFVHAVVIASSDKAYGRAVTLPYTEATELIGRAPYDVSKSCTDLISTSYSQTYNIPLSIARCGNIFGAGDRNWSRIIPSTFKSGFEGKNPQLRSDGTAIRDYIYIEDVVSAYKSLAIATTTNFFRGEAFNFSNNDPKSVLEICDLVLESIGRTDLKPEILNRATHEIDAQHLDSTKARKLLGWENKFEIRDALLLSATWYKKEFVIEQ